MVRVSRIVCCLVLALLPAPNGIAQPPNAPVANVNWEVPTSLLECTPRAFQSDGTLPAVGKGKFSRLDGEPARYPLQAEGVKAARTPPWMDPTYPVGLTEAGSAAPPIKAVPPRPVRPVTSGFGVALKQN